MTGNVGARVHIGGTSVNPYVSGSIKSNAISYDSYHIDSGEANLVISMVQWIFTMLRYTLVMVA